MKTTKFVAAVAFAAALLGAASSAGAAGLSPVGQFATATPAVRTADAAIAPRAYSVGVTTQPVVVQARKAQAPSAYELHSLLVRAPVKPEVVRAQGE